MNNLIKKISSLFFIGLFAFSLTTPAHAQYSNGELGDILKSDQMTLEKYTMGNNEEPGAISSIIPMSLATAIMGVRDSSGSQVKTGMMPVMTNTIAFMYQEPAASSGQYFANILDNIGFPTVNKAQAQGTGYNVLSPMISLWKVFRNLAYSIYIIIFIIIGVMIMFRTKINAQTVISIQSALPNLIITLILITFSYAIAGFLVDIMYFLIYFLVFLASTGGLLNGSGAAIERLTQFNANEVLFNDNNAIIKKAAEAISDLLLGLTVGDGWSNLIQAVTPDISLAYLIVAIGLAITMLKLMWTLLQSYIMVLVQTFTAPLQILPNAIPGSSSFMNWLKRTAANLAPFPIVAAMFLFAAILVGPTSCPAGIPSDINVCWFGAEGNTFDVKSGVIEPEAIVFPPFIAPKSAIQNETFLAVLGLFVLFMTPAAAKAAKEALQVKESPYSSEIMGGLGQGFSLASAGPKWLWGLRQEKKNARQQEEMFTRAMKNAQNP